VLRADGTLRSFPVRDVTGHGTETQVPHSTALPARPDGRRHLTDALARFAVDGRLLSPVAPEAARAAGLGDPREGTVCRNPFRTLLVRAAEVVYAVEEALRITGAYEPPRPYTEVPPTAQNQGAIEDDLLRVAQDAITGGDPDDAELTALCERAIRNHDPCTSCSAHFLDLTVVRT
jgi:coenzyme F420-reducing hydrogenase alpha subunit